MLLLISFVVLANNIEELFLHTSPFWNEETSANRTVYLVILSLTIGLQVISLPVLLADVHKYTKTAFTTTTGAVSVTKLVMYHCLIPFVGIANVITGSMNPDLSEHSTDDTNAATTTWSMTVSDRDSTTTSSAER